MDMISGFMNGLAPHKDGDMIDRLSYYYSVTLLCTFSIFLSVYYFLGKPLMCWFPVYYKRFWAEYALDYCYVQNTYFLPLADAESPNFFALTKNQFQIPLNITSREDREIGYYQWVPFILALEAIFFYIPVMVWRGGYTASSLQVLTILNEACSEKNVEPAERSRIVQKLARFMTYSINVSDQMGKRGGRYLTTLYIVTKGLFAANCIIQFFLLQILLGLSNFWFGLSILWDLGSNRDWSVTGNFPRITLCDFQVRVMGNLHRHTIQCALHINMFNEKIFVILWWWFLIVAVMSVWSFLYWLLSGMSEKSRKAAIRNYLNVIEAGEAKTERALVRRFIHDCLKPDGILLLRLVASNAGDVVCCDIIRHMWTDYKTKHGITRNAPPVRLAGNGAMPIEPPSYEATVSDEKPRIS